MKKLKWSALKSARLKRVRGVSFEELVASEFITIGDNPTREWQYIMYFKYKGQVWLVPFVEDKDHVFLKTLYPSRKFTKRHERGELI